MPVYGFERTGDPPPLEVDVDRLLDELSRGASASDAIWNVALSEETCAQVALIAAGAGDRGSFRFPDETWARVVYDFAVAHHERVAPLHELVAALVPLYFGRVASLITETTDLTTDEAEAFVGRQAVAFESAKPYLLARWRESS